MMSGGVSGPVNLVTGSGLTNQTPPPSLPYVPSANLQGYDVLLVKALPGKYKCPFCAKLLRNPIQTLHGDGQHACKECYLQARWDPAICPLSHAPVTDPPFFHDKHAEREILALEVFCSNKPQGCEWRGELSQLEKQHLPVCDFNPLSCPNVGCRVPVSRKTLAEHVANACEYQKVKCQHCGEEYSRSFNQEHVSRCEKVPQSCPFACGETNIPLVDIGAHVSRCPKLASGQICPFQLAGCKVKPSGEPALREHLHSAYEQHAALTISTISRLLAQASTSRVEPSERTAMLERRVEEGLNETRAVQGDLLDLQDKYTDMYQQFMTEKRVLDSRITELEERSSGAGVLEQVNKLTAEMARLQALHNATSERIASVSQTRGATASSAGSGAVMNQAVVQNQLVAISTRVESSENANAIMSANLSDLDLKLQLLENTSYEGRQLWKIDNVSYRMTQAVTGKVTALHSPPSFTKRFGYKFCTRLYLNGDGMGKGSHVSVFFVVMRGEFDQLLAWPFAHRVTFKLVSNNGQDVKETFLPDQKSSSFQKPSLDKDMNVAAGCPMFLTRDLLLQGSFIIDDSIFLETTISPILPGGGSV